jgi:hypothetical protein
LTESDLEHVARHIGRRFIPESSSDVAVHGIDVLVEQSGSVVVHALLLPAHSIGFILTRNPGVPGSVGQRIMLTRSA